MVKSFAHRCAPASALARSAQRRDGEGVGKRNVEGGSAEAVHHNAGVAGGLAVAERTAMAQQCVVGAAVKGKPVLSYLTGSAPCSGGPSLGSATGKQGGAAPDTSSTQLGRGQRAAGHAGRLALGKGGKAMVNYYNPEEEDEKDDDDDLPPGLTGDDGPEPFQEDSSSHRSRMSTTAYEKTGAEASGVTPAGSSVIGAEASGVTPAGSSVEGLRTGMLAKGSTRKDAPPIYITQSEVIRGRH